MTPHPMDLRPRCVANKLVWVLVLPTTNSVALALHRICIENAKSSLNWEKKSTSEATERDRQVAYFQYEFLSDVARRCPLDVQSVVIQQLLDEHRFAV